MFGRFLVDQKPLKEMRLGRFGDVFFETGVNALLDDAGNFAFVLEPGAYYLRWYDVPGERTRFFAESAPADPIWHLEVKAGEVRWVGAWAETAKEGRELEMSRIDGVAPVDVLSALASAAAGTAWEKRLAGDLERLRPVPRLEEVGAP